MWAHGSNLADQRTANLLDEVADMLFVSLTSESYSLTRLIKIHLWKLENFRKYHSRTRCQFCSRCDGLFASSSLCVCLTVKHTRNSTEAQKILYISRIIHAFSFIRLICPTEIILCWRKKKKVFLCKNKKMETSIGKGGFCCLF